jgi:WXG100 family type VII secretion target
MSARISVDLDQLAEVVARLADEHQVLESLASSLEAALAGLHDDWDGEAASAHAIAQARWDQGFAAMRAALAGMRAAADTARSNYAGAAEANRTMWRQLG